MLCGENLSARSLLPYRSRSSFSVRPPVAMSEPVATPPVIHAPDFPKGLDWINTGGRALTLADFRGKILLLDFWTYG